MKDFIHIGCTPTGEDCFQVGIDAPETLRAETHIFKRQLERVFPTAAFKVKAENHDFGTYYEVVAEYDEDDELQMNIAFEAESETPEFWDAIGKRELAELKRRMNK